MRIAVPSLGKDGLKERVCPHFGRAPAYTVVDTETGRVEIFDNTAEHFGGMGKAPELIQRTGADVVLCSGIGPMAVEMFENLGIRAFVGASGTVQSTVEAFESGRLQEATDENACAQHRR